MTKIRFSDGVEFDTSQDGYHLTHRQDGWYVVGRGTLCPVNGPVDGRRVIRELEALAAVKELGEKNTGSD
tara:strand:- start:1724 stop:1933 length:210 start_codon:yes stop_codon:yes gene_type:complete